MRRAIAFGTLCLVVAGGACTGQQTTSEPAAAFGAWGGAHVAMIVSDTGAALEYDCAHGAITTPLRLDATGRFDLPGYHVREHGGPVRDDERETRMAARYVGRVTGARMTLVVSLVDSGSSVGEFGLRYGTAPQLLKCL